MVREKRTIFFMNAPQKFADLGISTAILQSLDSLGLSVPTPVQSKAIPVAIAGQDLIGIAQTGTGKTLAFGIPMLQRLGRLKGQGLIITPTRELALQVEASLKKLGKPFGIRTAVLIGGEGLDKQLFQLRKKPHVIVATPGRLIDHLKNRKLKLAEVNVLVLDEADMMLDMGFAPQIREIIEQAPKDRQTMLFSATMPAGIVKIAAQYMKLPVSIEVAPPGTAAELVEQEIFIVENEKRLDHLLRILNEHAGSVLVFVRTKYGAKTLAHKLSAAGHAAAEIHSNLTLNRRRASLEAFRSGKARVLVATDVAARGLDISGIELVVNYNLPDNSDDYVHRIGRTGRAGKSGKAISLATPEERREIIAIERLIKKSIPRREYAPLPSHGSKPERHQVAGRHQRGTAPRRRLQGRPSGRRRSAGVSRQSSPSGSGRRFGFRF